MTLPRDPDPILAAWLEEGPNRLPEATRRAIAVTTRTTHQTRRPKWLSWRFSTMNGTSRLALAAVAVVAVALGGLYLFTLAPDSGVGGPSPTPPPATPSPSPSPASISFDSHGFGELEPGTYVFERLDNSAALRITFTVPAGWEKLRVPGMIWAAPGSDANLAFAIVDNLYVDPCAADRATHVPPIGPTVDDLVTALDATPGLDAAATDITLAGFAGKQVELTALAASEPCEVGDTAALFPLGGPDNDWPPPAPTDQSRLWILDVDGHRLVIKQNVRPAATAADRAELQAIVDSIRIERAPTDPEASASPTP